MKKIIAFFMVMILSLGVVAGCSQTQGNDGKKDSEENTENAQVICPFVTCENMEELEKQVGFSIEVKDSESFTVKTILAYTEMPDKMAEIVYDTVDGDCLTVRKAPGTDDISGDYNEYTLEETTDTGVVLKGDKETSLIYLAVWTAGEYTYSFNSSEGMTKAAMEGIVANIE